MDSNYPNYYGNNQHSQTNPNANRNSNAHMPIDPNLLNHPQLSQMMGFYSQPQQIPSISNAPNFFQSQFNPNFFPSPNMFSSQNIQFPSPNLECPSSQPYNKSPRTPVSDVGSSRILFQDLEDNVDEDDFTIPSDQPGKSKSKIDKRAWTIAEDKALCSAYLEAGGDVLTGTDQKKRELWASIMEMFAQAQRENPSTINERNYDSCDCRWRRINSQVNKWVGIYQKVDASGRLGLSIEQKCTAAMRILAYGTAYDSVDEHLNVTETTSKECLVHFVEGVITQFRNHYMRRPNVDDIATLLRQGEERGFPGMMGSIDCMHWTWKNCSRGWRGQFQGRNKTPTLILEAVASRDLWIWHAFFGTLGSCNDINVLDRSPVFTDILEGHAPPVNYIVNNHSYNMAYYLTDGIYPKWAAFISSISAPQTEKHKLFAKKQESVRKDVERAFGVLQARFAIIRQPALAWSRSILGKIMLSCIIIHNMIVEDERSTYTHFDPKDYEEDSSQNQASTSSGNQRFTFFNVREYDLSSYMSNRSRVRDTNINKSLKKDLIENIWEKFNDEVDDN